MVVLLCIAFLDESEIVEKIGRMKIGLVSMPAMLHKLLFYAETVMSETLPGPG